MPSGEPFAFAGLYEIWKDKEAAPGAGPYKSCTIITTEASASVKDIHHRMPLILKPEAYDAWLDPDDKEPAKIEELLKTALVRELKRYPVSQRVNRTEYNSRNCIERLLSKTSSIPSATKSRTQLSHRWPAQKRKRELTKMVDSLGF